jgi:hypothetical protein
MNGVVQEMFAAYANDVSSNRAEKMEDLLRKGSQIARPLIDACPYEWMDTPDDH